MNSALRRRIAPSVPLTLELLDDGGATFKREFRLAFDFNVCATIEEKTGVNVLDAIDFLKRLISPKTISVYFWAALLPHHPEYDEPEGLRVVRSYMDESNLEKISEAVVDAYLQYCPEKKRNALREIIEKGKKGENPTQPPKPAEPEAAATANPSPGSSSGPLPEATSALAMTNSAA
jgi:hypothetical protein